MNNINHNPFFIDFDEIKIEKIKIFNYEIIKCKIPKKFYDKKSLKESITSLFNSEIVLTRGNETPEQTGKAHSTVKLGSQCVENLSDVNPLIDYISASILKGFYGDFDCNKKILYNRMWINKMYKNCAVRCHQHHGDCNDGSAIFYYNVAQNGSKLIILKDNIDCEVKKCHKKISHYITVETGDLIIHKKDVPHAVSKHMNDIPRICFVFDFFSKTNNENLKLNYM
jgi:hypothetical protein